MDLNVRRFASLSVGARFIRVEKRGDHLTTDGKVLKKVEPGLFDRRYRAKTRFGRIVKLYKDVLVIEVE